MTFQLLKIFYHASSIKRSPMYKLANQVFVLQINRGVETCLDHFGAAVRNHIGLSQLALRITNKSAANVIKKV